MIRRFVLAALLLLLLLLASPALAQGTITIEWDPSPPAPDRVAVAGYIVHVGTVSGSYPVDIDAGKVLRYTYAATEQRGYYFQVSAYGFHEGVRLEGERSEEVVGAPKIPTPSPTESPDGTRVPPASSLTDSTGAIFTLGDPYPDPNVPDNFYLLRNGVSASNGIGSYYVYLGHNVYTLGTDKICYRWGNTAGTWEWLGVPEPCQTGPVTPPNPVDTVAPSITMTVGARKGNNYPVTISNVVDNVGIHHVEVLVNEILQLHMLAPTSGTINTPGAVWRGNIQIKAPGTYRVTGRAIDTSTTCAPGGKPCVGEAVTTINR